MSNILCDVGIERSILYFFFFNDTATTEIYTLSLHDALPILRVEDVLRVVVVLLPRAEHLVARLELPRVQHPLAVEADRKSTRLNSSHANISYAVFCLKKKKKNQNKDFKLQTS